MDLTSRALGQSSEVTLDVVAVSCLLSALRSGASVPSLVGAAGLVRFAGHSCKKVKVVHVRLITSRLHIHSVRLDSYRCSDSGGPSSRVGPRELDMHFEKCQRLCYSGWDLWEDFRF